MAQNWKRARADERITKRLEEVKNPEVIDYTREKSLDGISTNRAYRVNGAHLYLDILNISDMLAVTDKEGSECHKRTLRFLNLHYRAVARVLDECDSTRVDMANQRLHAVVAKPYDSADNAECTRVHRAVAIAQLLIDVLAETGDTDEKIPMARVRAGIDCGFALAVNNGRRGAREPLFLGQPANRAAKRAAGGAGNGIFLTNDARKAIGLKALAETALDSSPLAKEEVAASQKVANLNVNKDGILRDWKEDLKNNPIGKFEFSGHTPPYCDLDVDTLSASNSRRNDAMSIFADIDGFTSYVRKHIEEKPEDVVRALHVLRSELDAALDQDLWGIKIRFIGDCIHGLVVEGTAQTTDIEKTISTAIIAAGAMRSSFNLGLQRLEKEGIDIGGLGLAIGLEFGSMTATRLGVKGALVRCSVSRGVLGCEAEQKRCGGVETAIGSTAYESGNDAVRALFSDERIVANLDYDAAVEGLSNDGDKTARKMLEEAVLYVVPAQAAAIARPVRAHAQ
ncbi:MAG: adenylate/guanylate cyclase domain-containing protein [Pirellulaceae bacterium]